MPEAGQHRDAGRSPAASRWGGRRRGIEREALRQWRCSRLIISYSPLCLVHTHEKHIASFDCTHWLTPSRRPSGSYSDHCCYNYCCGTPHSRQERTRALASADTTLRRSEPHRLGEDPRTLSRRWRRRELAGNAGRRYTTNSSSNRFRGRRTYQ